MAAKALAASEKKLASEAKKLAVKGLQEKKKQLLASYKTKGNVIKVAALQKKTAALFYPTQVLHSPSSLGFSCISPRSPSLRWIIRPHLALLHHYSWRSST
jgi:hypothetical protein